MGSRLSGISEKYKVRFAFFSEKNSKCKTTFFVYSIPIENRDGVFKYSECKMFQRNYTQILRTLNVNGPVDFLRHYNFAEQQDDNSTEIYCVNGWNYDRRMFPNTVVMEVRSFFSLFLVYHPTQIKRDEKRI